MGSAHSKSKPAWRTASFLNVRRFFSLDDKSDNIAAHAEAQQEIKTEMLLEGPEIEQQNDRDIDEIYGYLATCHEHQATQSLVADVGFIDPTAIPDVLSQEEVTELRMLANNEDQKISQALDTMRSYPTTTSCALSQEEAKELQIIADNEEQEMRQVLDLMHSDLQTDNAAEIEEIDEIYDFLDRDGSRQDAAVLRPSVLTEQQHKELSELASKEEQEIRAVLTIMAAYFKQVAHAQVQSAQAAQPTCQQMRIPSFMQALEEIF